MNKLKKLKPNHIKKVLIVLVLFLFGSIIFWPTKDKNLIPLNQTKKEQKKQLYNFEYKSKDKNGKPFVLYGRKATNTDKKNVRLIDVKFEFYRTENDLITFYSNKAFVNRDKNIIILEENVRAIMNDGHKFKTEKATYNINDRILSGNLPIKGEGPAGFIDGTGFVIYNKTRKFVIYKVHPMTLKKAEADKK